MTLLSDTIRNTIEGFLDVDQLGNPGWRTPREGAERLAQLILQSGAIGAAIEGTFAAGQSVGRADERRREVAEQRERLADEPTMASALTYIANYALMSMMFHDHPTYLTALAEVQRAAEVALFQPVASIPVK